MLVAVIGFTVLAAWAAEAISGAYGVGLGQPISNTPSVEVDPYHHRLNPPHRVPDFQSYFARVTAAGKVASITAETVCPSLGEARAKYADLQTRLTTRYGPPLWTTNVLTAMQTMWVNADSNRYVALSLMLEDRELSLRFADRTLLKQIPEP